MKTVLVSGGAGYIGSVLVRQLLDQDYNVRVIDLLKFGGETLLELMNHPHFSFIKGDVRNEKDLERALEGVDYVAHLASIVGDPACAKFPDEAKSTNLEGSQLFYSMANKMGVKKFIFASTCSNYGKMEDSNSFVNEESQLRPVSLYAETKVAVEKFLMDQNRNNSCKPTCLRFSTVYGLSPRPRFDLTVNEFAKELAMGRELVIFGEQFWRPYCHVIDLARSVVEVIKAPAEIVAFDVFNVGDTSENFQKKMIVDEVVKQLGEGKIKYVQKDEDPRDYRVSFDKIREKLGFKITKTMSDGVREMIMTVKQGFYQNPDDARYRNI